MAATKVAIVGAGIAGPVLAMLLKQKGYDPALYERTESVTSAGLSLAYGFTNSFLNSEIFYSRDSYLDFNRMASRCSTSFRVS